LSRVVIAFAAVVLLGSFFCIGYLTIALIAVDHPAPTVRPEFSDLPPAAATPFLLSKGRGKPPGLPMA
jgi:hypothetical protein